MKRCGNRLAIQNATLAPADPASLVLIQLHFEWWECVKLLHKQASKRLIGDAQIRVKLTPAIGTASVLDPTSFRSDPFASS